MQNVCRCALGYAPRTIDLQLLQPGRGMEASLVRAKRIAYLLTIRLAHLLCKFLSKLVAARISTARMFQILSPIPMV